MHVGILALLAGGVTAAFVGGLWGRGWIWTAMVILVLVGLAKLPGAQGTAALVSILWLMLFKLF